MPRRNPLKVNEELLQRYLGRWKIESSYYQSLNVDDTTNAFPHPVTELEQIEFTLDEQYDITWHLLPGVERNELFQTSSFDVDETGITLRGSPDGKSYSFEVQVEGDIIKLASHVNISRNEEEGFFIVLRKVVISNDASSFSLLDALKEEYFSDLTIRSSQGKKFKTHRCVLNTACPGVKYRDWEMLLSGLSSDAVYAALYYAYSSNLPPNLEVGVARELAEVTNGNQKLNHLNGLCTTCIESCTLTNRLQELVDSLVHSLEVARQIIVSAKMDDPAKVVYATKQLAREVAIAASRAVLLCQLYTKNKQEMTKSERRQVLEYVQGRIIVFVNEGRELLQLLIAKWDSLTDIQKSEIALYIIPHINQIWEQINQYAAQLHTTIEGQQETDGSAATPPSSSSSSSHGKGLSLKLAVALQFNSSAKDLKRIQKMRREFKKFVNVGEQRRAQFTELTDEEKTEAIKRIIQEMIHDAEGSIQRLELLKKKILIANALDWSSYKLGVSLVCSYTSWGVDKLLTLKDPIKPIVKKISHLVGHKEFNSTLVQLGVAEAAHLFEETQTIPSLPSLSEGKCSMNSVNLLSKGCSQLLETGELADMEFVVQDTPIDDHTHNPLDLLSANDSEQKNIVIPAHRVILAARSEWFRRALQSGMIEDRDRRVIVKDVEVSLFRMFLDYLYGKQMNYQSMSKDELIELLTVADRYETTSLHQTCETHLISLISSDNVFSLLITADQLNSRQLRAHTLQYVLDNPDVLINKVDAYSELPIELKDEVRQILSGTQELSQFSIKRHQPGVEPPISSPSDDTLNGGPSYIEDTNELYASALTELRVIVGEEPTDDDLKALLLAADMDINRAVNFFFGSQ